MGFDRIVILTLTLAIVEANTVENNTDTIIDKNSDVDNSADAFNGVYTECLFSLSFSCLQKKTLVYLNRLNNMNEVSVIGEYVKFVKINTTVMNQSNIEAETRDSDELSLDIDSAVNTFFDSHILQFKAYGKNIAAPRTVDEFVGRKKRKGGGGGGGGHDDGKKKMMMMAMMCMKMKMMMMIPAMMGMMGMMSFKGMMFSMMSFMISKMMLLMKILEKKGGGATGGGGGGDGWAAGGGGGGAWMPAGGQDYGGGGGGYDANGQWQSRSIIEAEEHSRTNENSPVISYVTPLVRYNNNPNGKKPYLSVKNLNDEFIKANNDVKLRTKRENDRVIKYRINANEKDPYPLTTKLSVEIADATSDGQSKTNRLITPVTTNKENANAINPYSQVRSMNTETVELNNSSKSRKKRGIIDVLQSAYLYWINQVLGGRYKNKLNYPKYKIVNGVKYVYHPLRYLQKAKKPKALNNDTKVEEVKTVITAEDFNKGEIVEGPVEGRNHKKKIMKMKDSVSETVDDNPWE